MSQCFFQKDVYFIAVGIIAFDDTKYFQIQDSININLPRVIERVVFTNNELTLFYHLGWKVAKTNGTPTLYRTIPPP
jgi:hypothetical protein